jgi:hypothetical protein
MLQRRANQKEVVLVIYGAKIAKTAQPVIFACDYFRRVLQNRLASLLARTQHNL